MSNALQNAWQTVSRSLPTPRSPRLAEDLHLVGSTLASLPKLLEDARAELVRLAPSGGTVNHELLARLDQVAPPQHPPGPAPAAPPSASPAEAPRAPAPAPTPGTRPTSPHVRPAELPARPTPRAPLDLFPVKGGALDGGRAQALAEWIRQATEALVMARTLLTGKGPKQLDQADVLQQHLGTLLAHIDENGVETKSAPPPAGQSADGKKAPPTPGAPAK